MRDRITLLIIILVLWTFLITFPIYVPKYPALVLILGFIIAYTILFNIAERHQRRKNKKNPPKLDESYRPFVTIMIPAHNEQAVIAETVKNISSIDYDYYEIIVIDDRSDDKTAEVLLELEKQNSRVKALIRDKEAFPGKSAVLNDAFEIAKGDVICVFDADARVEPDFLKKIIPNLAPKEVGAVQARKVISNREHNFLTRCQDNEYVLDAYFQFGRDAIKGAVELRGNGELIKREAIEDVDGWNNYTIVDDLDLSTRLHLKGWDIRFCRDVCVYEEGVKDFFPLIRQRRRWVEGSIRRYLDYFIDVLFSKDMSIRVSLDMYAYIAEFLLPVWLISECALQSVWFIDGNPNHMLSSFMMIGVVGVFFFVGLLYSLRKYNKLSIWQTIKQSAETGVYLVTLWTPIVIFIVFKIIFVKRSMDWGKTSHGEIPEEVSSELKTS
ncbi:MAG TPA: glycosyltransferase family 2 protein [Candidatus Adamsella sp.]|nr:glycosyltransferase family 2 protein [Candidatus Adamsella sp.]